MVQYERLWRVTEETDLIQLVFCHPADAGVVVGGLVVRQNVLRNTGQRYKPAVSANAQPAKGKANLGKKNVNNRWRCTVDFKECVLLLFHGIFFSFW